MPSISSLHYDNSKANTIMVSLIKNHMIFHKKYKLNNEDGRKDCLKLWIKLLAVSEKSGSY